MFRLGHTVFWLGVLLTGLGLLIGLFGRGWTALVIGFGFVLVGVITSQIPVVYVGNQVKMIDESLTAKQVSDLVSCHLAGHGDQAEDTAVFLGEFGGEVEVVKKLRKAAEQGQAEAQYRLGSCYLEGSGVIKDEAEAVKWYRKAADQGDAMPQFHLANCCFNVANCYLDGRGVTKDIGEAVMWFRKAAD